MDGAEVEGLAAHLLERGRFGDEPNPWDIIAACRARVVQARPGERPHPERRPDGGWDLIVDATERPERVATTALHELSHLLLLKAGLPNDEPHAWRLASALALPRLAYLGRLRAAGGRADLLASVYPHASHELLARRAVDLGDDRVLHVWDVEPIENRYRIVSRGWRWRRTAPTAPESEAMAAALESRAPVEPVGGVRAWPVIDGAWVRVLCLSSGEVLEAFL
jgi:hypothetical protein